MIPTRVHGILDYLSALVLIVIPAAAYGPSSTAALVPMALGVATLLYSLGTAYELGLVKLIPVRIHLMLDMVNGLLLAASPWIFGFTDLAWAPHLLFGLFEIGVAALTVRASAVRTAAHPAL